ncbi:hypothetical protein BDU57DRAFT_479091 [Ampelomyces quisqualis]|uniref:SAM-dependent MTase RsmB/NOP-type domain-containing protein n=1 Tax=Ampelomyces quisqualis TaxID=50730 RepID=A0A6A5QH56_AMPQU|nr:hypothetical protein BDU57DRAFT_479091 [Ampelomyces quisqualis]
MSLYYEAAAILANADNAGGSLKSRLFTKKDLKSSPGHIFALIAEASKWSVVLKDVIEKCGLLAAERKLTPILALLLTHDLLVAKGGVAAAANHVLKLAVTRHRARLGAEFTKARIRYGHPTLAAFKDAVSNGDLEDHGQDRKATRHPRWVRVNTIQTDLETQLRTTFAGFAKTDSLAEVLAARGDANMYYEDPNIPNLLALPPKISLARSEAYATGQIILQDKASCFPACLLDLSPDDGDVIDGCAAPGNKTTHLAAIVSSQTGPPEAQKVIAFERDAVRTKTLQKMVKLASADSIVSVKGDSDFLAAKPHAKEFSSVGAIVLDPSCSGTGIVGRDDGIKIHLPSPSPAGAASQSSSKNKKRKREDEKNNKSEPAMLNLHLDDSTPEETPVKEKLMERLATLSNFQLHILTHAMRFASAHKITYSTCSIHFEENEGVVFQALASSIARQRGWKILKRERQVQGMRNWNKRGVWEDDKLSYPQEESLKQEVLDACIRCDKGTDEGTMGFFVAAFVRDPEEPRQDPSEVVDIEEVEWDGFSDGDVQDSEKALEDSFMLQQHSPVSSLTTTMFPSTPPAANLSRTRLKALATWVRDELDLLVAREGPNVLQPDDVLALHETFIALRHATDITALDLRATGIHRAVQDIAGVATRWPGRLCDDCDKIISIWTTKFGPLSELRPFLYGRGGRLEGIASIHEYSREALLKRWSNTCPDKLHPRRSHRLGDLGFRPGDWWINTLFAHHAGIIGLEAVEGGTTFDKHGAYALVLKDAGEVEAGQGDAFTYRIPQWDKGKYRLTAAIPRSRHPIRVLRSHNINSVWGPKTGVRYEGLYAVKGWSIRQAKSADAAGGQWKEGDILYEVRFERNDPVPMQYVTIRPTATEVDDYTEYKRLRRLQREGMRRGPGLTIDLSNVNPLLPSKAAPPVAPLQSVPRASPPKTQHSSSPGTTRRVLFRQPHFDVLDEHTMDDSQPASTLTSAEIPHVTPSPTKEGTLLVPGRNARRTAISQNMDHSASSSKRNKSPTTSTTSDVSAQSYVREVAPWLDFDSTDTTPASPPMREDSLAPSVRTASSTGPTTKKNMLARLRPAEASPSAMASLREKKKSVDVHEFPGLLRQAEPSKAPKNARKSIFVRGRGVVGRVVDGVDEDGDGDEAAIRFVDNVTSCSDARRSATVSTSADQDCFLQEGLLRAEYGGIVFTDLFWGPRVAGEETNGVMERRDSVGVAPDCAE